MITIIGSLIGFGTSMLPRVFDMFQDWQDRKQELEIMDRQIKMAEMKHEQRLEELHVKADIQESKAIYKHASSMKNKVSGTLADRAEADVCATRAPVERRRVDASRRRESAVRL